MDPDDQHNMSEQQMERLKLFMNKGTIDKEELKKSLEQVSKTWEQSSKKALDELGSMMGKDAVTGALDEVSGGEPKSQFGWIFYSEFVQLAILLAIALFALGKPL